MNESTMRDYYSKAFQNIIEEYAPAAVMSSYNGTTVYRNNELLTSMSGQKIDYVALQAQTPICSQILLQRSIRLRRICCGRLRRMG